METPEQYIEPEIDEDDFMEALESFTSSYFETALWSSTDTWTDEYGEEHGDDNCGASLDDFFAEDDFNHEHKRKLISECEAFLRENWGNIKNGGVNFSDPFHRAGHDYWLTQNRHGAGFWDGDWKEPFAALLTNSSHLAGERNLYVGEQGVIYCCECH
jgi:hypothetical protein